MHALNRSFKLSLEHLESRRLLTAFYNADLPCDVNRSGMVTPLDALLVINDLNRIGARPVSVNQTNSAAAIDVNNDGMVSPLDAIRIINVLNTNLPTPRIVFSVAGSQDLNANGVLVHDQVTLHGQTIGAWRIQIDAVALDASLKPDRSRHSSHVVLVAEDGSFSWQQPLYLGTNQITVTAFNHVGHQVTTSREIVRGDLITDWNAAILNVVRDWTTTSDDPYQGRIVPSAPPIVARNLAMIHTAMADAINGVLNDYETYLDVDSLLAEAINGSSSHTADIDRHVIAEVAASTAAREVASRLYNEPDEIAAWDATWIENTGQFLESTDKDIGQDFGTRVAAAMLQHRVEDGSNNTSNYSPTGDIGDWNRTLPDHIPPLLPQWPGVTPFVIENVVTFRPVPPPELTSEEYAIAVDEVMKLGDVNSILRSADQTEIAVFWADGGGTATPPGHWNRIASHISLIEGQTTVQRARSMALLNLALADAGIASWDAKYAHDLWRPIDAIRQASEDGNPITTADPTWLPLLRTPPFPTYTSGHSTFSAAAATVLSHLFGEVYTFSSRSDEHTGLAQRPVVDTTVRSYDSFWQAAEEAGFSRIFGGIHFSFDNTEGLLAGREVADFVVDTVYRSIPAI